MKPSQEQIGVAAAAVEVMVVDVAAVVVVVTAVAAVIATTIVSNANHAGKTLTTDYTDLIRGLYPCNPWRMFLVH
jgi:hypothetical protein